MYFLVGEPDDDDDEEEESVLKGALYLLAGGILIVLFSSPFITSVVEVATFWNFSPTLLAFFLAPVASEAPEILESISLSRKGNVQNINIAISNMVGGTITKTTLLCGVCIHFYYVFLFMFTYFLLRFYVFMEFLENLLGNLVILYLWFY